MVHCPLVMKAQTLAPIRRRVLAPRMTLTRLPLRMLRSSFFLNRERVVALLVAARAAWSGLATVGARLVDRYEERGKNLVTRIDLAMRALLTRRRFGLRQNLRSDGATLMRLATPIGVTARLESKFASSPPPRFPLAPLPSGLYAARFRWEAASPPHAAGDLLDPADDELTEIGDFISPLAPTIDERVHGRAGEIRYGNVASRGLLGPSRRGNLRA